MRIIGIVLAVLVAGCAAQSAAPVHVADPIEVAPVVVTAAPAPVPQVIRTTVQRIVVPSAHVAIGEETDVYLIEPGGGWPRCVVANGAVSCGWRDAR